MAKGNLSNCSQCGHIIAANAERCVGCGAPGDDARRAPKPKRPLWKTLVGIGVGLIAVLAAIAFISPAPEDKPAQTGSTAQAPDIEIDAGRLVREYGANEVAADQKYKGRILEVSGRVEHVGKDIANTAYIEITAGYVDDVFGVQCFLSSEEENAAAQISPGQTIMVRGTCDGKFGNVLLKDCSISAH